MKNVKSILKTIAVLCFAMLLFASCSKDGAQGPMGPAGAQGAKGDAGPVGPAGKDGSILYSGTGAPTSGVGKNGDYYLDKISGNLYGPKTDNGWGAAINLKGQKGDKGSTGANGAKGDKGSTGATGAQGNKGDKGDTGAAGQNGSKILSGNGIPSASIGAIGDFYLDKTNTLLYGPKQTATNWGPGLMLKGKDGNANVKAYLITNPYDYLNRYAMGAFDIPASSGNFNLGADVQNNYLISVYVKGANNSMFPANQDFKGSYNCTYFFDFGELYIRIYKDDGSSWSDLNTFKTHVNLTSFLVFDIAPSSVITMSSSPAEKQKAIKALIKPYLQ